MRGIRGHNAGERERLRQEHMRVEALQVWVKAFRRKESSVTFQILWKLVPAFMLPWGEENSW